MDRDEAIKRIRAGLKARSGKAWSVTGGRGTAWGWIHVDVPPARRGNPDEYVELGKLLGVDPERSAHLVPASNDYREEYVARAEGRTPSKIAQPYWD